MGNLPSCGVSVNDNRRCSGFDVVVAAENDYYWCNNVHSFLKMKDRRNIMAVIGGESYCKKASIYKVR